MVLKFEYVYIIFIKSFLFIGDLFSLKMVWLFSFFKLMSRIVVDCFCVLFMIYLFFFILFVVECWLIDYFIIDYVKEMDFKVIIWEYG